MHCGSIETILDVNIGRMKRRLEDIIGGYRGGYSMRRTNASSSGETASITILITIITTN
jgi:hypothetical protein